MSDSASSRSKGTTQGARAPLFEVREKPLPPPPQPLQTTRDPFDDLPEVGPRTQRRQTIVPAPPLVSRRPLDDEPLQRPAPGARSSYAEATADLHRAQIASGQVDRARPVFTLSTPQRSIFELFQDYPWLFALVAGACIVIILLVSAPARTVISRYTVGGETQAISDSVAQVNIPPGQHSVLGQPTLRADDIDAVLAKFGSPAAGSGQVWIELGKRYGINPAYALAFFIHESTAGTNPGWAGLKPDGSSTHNIGNIICAGYPTCFGRFRDYPSWEAGIEDWYKLIANEYINDRGVRTVEQIIPIYAPASDNNNVAGYIQAVVSTVQEWQRQGVDR